MTYFTDKHITKFHCRLQKRTMDDVDEWRSFAMWAHTTRAYTEQNRWTYGEYMLTHSPYESTELWEMRQTVSKKFPATIDLCVCTET